MVAGALGKLLFISPLNNHMSLMCWFNAPLGCCAFDRSQTGAAARPLLACIFVANMLKYSATESKPPGDTASALSAGVAGAASTEAPSADASSMEARIVAVV